jgi:dCMP deaminase
MNLQNWDNDLRKWDSRFLDLAKLVSTWSKDPSTKVGSVIADQNNRIVSLGYNGFPVGIVDNDRLEDRETKYKIVVHAECNAMMFANASLKNCTIYTYPFMPCPKCAGMIIQAGITNVVSYDNEPERWKDDFEISRRLFNEANIMLTLYQEQINKSCGAKCKTLK